MKIVVYPSDSYGCGHFRMIWPGEALAAAGHDVEVIRVEDRRVKLVMEDDTVRDVLVDADVVVFQRITHRWMAQAVPVMRAKGITGKDIQLYGKIVAVADSYEIRRSALQHKVTYYTTLAGAKAACIGMGHMQALEVQPLQALHLQLAK